MCNFILIIVINVLSLVLGMDKWAFAHMKISKHTRQ